MLCCRLVVMAFAVTALMGDDCGNTGGYVSPPPTPNGYKCLCSCCVLSNSIDGCYYYDEYEYLVRYEGELNCNDYPAWQATDFPFWCNYLCSTDIEQRFGEYDLVCHRNDLPPYPSGYQYRKVCELLPSDRTMEQLDPQGVDSLKTMSLLKLEVSKPDSSATLTLETDSGIKSATFALAGTMALEGMADCPRGSPVCTGLVRPFLLWGDDFSILGQQIQGVRFDSQQDLSWVMFWDQIMFVENGDGFVWAYVGGQPTGSVATVPNNYYVPILRSQRWWSASFQARTTIAGFPATINFNLVGTMGNHPPFANAGSDQSIPCTPWYTMVTLTDQSTDIDGDDDIVRHQWSTLEEVPFSPGAYRKHLLGEGTQITVALTAGVHHVVDNAWDSAGNPAFDLTVVDVVDTEPPQLWPPPRNTVECTSPSGTELQSQVIPPRSDNCGPVSASNDHGDALYPLGLTFVTWVGADAAGNKSTPVVGEVLIEDTTPPVLSGVPAPVTVDAVCGKVDPGSGEPRTEVMLASPTAVDRCDAPSSLRLWKIPASDLYATGTTQVTFVAQDSSGNQALATTSVTAVDSKPPVLANVPGPIALEATCELYDLATGQRHTYVPVSMPTATDTCDLTPQMLTDHPDDLFLLGTTTITFTALDDSGNAASATTTVTLTDTTPPDVSGLSLSGPDCLWAPDHKYVVLRADRDFAGAVLDACDPTPRLAFASAQSSQPDHAAGDGNTTEDIVVFSDRVCLRSERSGQDPSGRVYEFRLHATDASGNAAEAPFAVRVVHDQNNHDCTHLDAQEFLDIGDPTCIQDGSAPGTSAPAESSAAAAPSLATQTGAASCAQSNPGGAVAGLALSIVLAKRLSRRRARLSSRQQKICGRTAGACALFLMVAGGSACQPRATKSESNAPIPSHAAASSAVTLPQEMTSANAIAFDGAGRLLLCGATALGPAVYRLILQGDQASYAADAGYGANGRAAVSIALPVASAACSGFQVLASGEALVRDASWWWLISADGASAIDAGIGMPSAVAVRGAQAAVITAVYGADAWIVTRHDMMLRNGRLEELGSGSLPELLMTAALADDGGLIGGVLRGSPPHWAVAAYTQAGAPVFAIDTPGDGQAQYCSVSGVVVSAAHVLVADLNCGALRLYDATGAYVDTVPQAAGIHVLPAVHSNGHAYALIQGRLVDAD